MAEKPRTLYIILSRRNSLCRILRKQIYFEAARLFPAARKPAFGFWRESEDRWTTEKLFQLTRKAFVWELNIFLQPWILSDISITEAVVKPPLKKLSTKLENSLPPKLQNLKSAWYHAILARCGIDYFCQRQSREMEMTVILRTRKTSTNQPSGVNFPLSLESGTNVLLLPRFVLNWCG